MVPTSRPGVFSRIVAVTDDLAMRFAVRVSRFVIVSLGGLGSGRILRSSMQDDVPVSAAKRRLRTCEWTRSLRGPNATYEAGNPGVPGRSCSYVVIVPFSPRGRTDSPHESWQTVLAKLLKARQLDTRPRDGVWAFACEFFPSLAYQSPSLLHHAKSSPLQATYETIVL